MSEMPLTLADVSFDYGSHRVVDNVSYAFRPGRLTAICGPNGSGKSTLFSIVSGQIAPKSGQILLNGQAVAALTAKQRAQQMAMLPQSPDAPSELLVRDLVALGRYAHRTPSSGLAEADRVAIDTALSATEMNELADRPLAALSGGQRQRAWIAMVLAQEAPLVLLDEPTNHLDVGHAMETLDLLKKLVAEQGKSVVAILHDINLMASHADDVVLMKDGSVLASGTFEDVVKQETIHTLYGRPCQLGSVPGRDRPFIVVQ